MAIDVGRAGSRSGSEGFSLVARPNAVLRLDGVSVVLGGVRILEEVAFAVGPGALVGVVGPNGGGKSTLFNAIVGLAPLSAGSITIRGGQPGERPAKGRVAYVPQREDVNWRFPLTGWDVVMLGRSPRIGWLRRPGRADRTFVRSCLERVGMREHEAAPLSDLSGGQRQRIFVARALAQEADILLLDEAFSGVDVGSQEGLVGVLRGLRDEGRTILVATHDLTNLARRFDEVLCLNRHVCAWGAPETAFTPAVLEELYGAHGIRFANGGAA